MARKYIITESEKERQATILSAKNEKDHEWNNFLQGNHLGYLNILLAETYDRNKGKLFQKQSPS